MITPCYPGAALILLMDSTIQVSGAGMFLSVMRGLVSLRARQRLASEDRLPSTG